MRKTDPENRRMLAITRRFERKVTKAVQGLTRDFASLLSKTEKASRKSARKSSPAQVRRLQEKILASLRRPGGPWPAQAVFSHIGLKPEDAGRFAYALEAMKKDGRVRQTGLRRVAKYEAAGDA